MKDPWQQGTIDVKDFRRGKVDVPEQHSRKKKKSGKRKDLQIEYYGRAWNSQDVMWRRHYNGKFATLKQAKQSLESVLKERDWLAVRQATREGRVVYRHYRIRNVRTDEVVYQAKKVIQPEKQ